MARYKKILVAFDGSDSSKNALRQAIKLARTEKSWIKVVSVVPSFVGDLDLTGVHDPDKAIRGPAEKLVKEARAIAEAENATILTDIEQGEAYEMIVEVADSENCDLIVMGRKGHGRFEKALVGCVTERVIGHTHKDVLVVPRESSVEWDRIVLSSDGSKASEAATTRAVDFAKSYGSELDVIGVVDVTDEFHAYAPAAVEKMAKDFHKSLGAVKEKAESEGVKTRTFVKEGDAWDEITDLAEEEGAKLIVMGSHGRTALGKLLMGSVTQKVIGMTKRPVLVVRS